MNEQSNGVLPNLLREEAFPTEKRGYNKRQVDDYVVRNHNQIRDLQERLARAHDELEQFRRELTEAKEKAAVKPEHEQISERMATILRIAEEEAKDKRAKVDGEVDKIRAEAEEAAAKRMKDAEEHAERVVASARSEAQDMVTTAKQESEQLRAQAEQDSQRRISDAESRAKKINDTADRRLATLTATHSEAVRRLSDMHETLAELLGAEKSAGPLEAGLSQEEHEAERAASAKKAEPAKPAEPATSADPAQPGGSTAPKQPQSRPQPARAASGPQQPVKPETARGADTEEVTVRVDPADAPESDEEATVRVDPATASATAQEGIVSKPVRQTPPRSQGAHYGTSAAHQQSAAAPAASGDGNDPGVTGVYKTPEGAPRKPEGAEANEGVRIIKP